MKRLNSVLLILCLLLGLMACGQKSASAPSWQEQYDLGIRYLSEGNYAEAIIAFTAAIEIDPKQVDAYLGRAEAYIGTGETAEALAAALADYEAVLGIDETLAAGYLGLADVYIRMGDYEKALEVLWAGIEKSGGDAAIQEKIAEMESGNIADASGKVRRMNSYDGNGALLWYHTYTYDAQGREQSVTSFDAGGNQTSHLNLVYDKAGNELVGYSIDYDTGLVSRVENDYNEAGLWVEERWYDTEGGGLIQRTAYQYNTKGQRIGLEHYSTQDGNEKLDNYYEYILDSNGKVVEERSYDGEGKLGSYTLNEYNCDGNLVKESYYTADGTLCSSSMIEYTENGIISTYTSETYDRDGNVRDGYSTVYRFDENGKRLGYDEYDVAGNLTRSTVQEPN